MSDTSQNSKIGFSSFTLSMGLLKRKTNAEYDSGPYLRLNGKETRTKNGKLSSRSLYWIGNRTASIVSPVRLQRYMPFA